MSEAGEADAPRTALSRIQKLRELAGHTDDFGFSDASLEALLRNTRPRLLEYARCVGLTGIQRLTKAALAERLRQEIARLVALAGAPGPAAAAGTFDLGPSSAGSAEDIPWGHGRDRVTAMVVDPERLYVYWEVTDEALERARADLGRGGRDAWLSLRVYDVTNRIFDGTNAHAYFDHSVSRTDRQWFFFIGKPSSTAVVEVGLKSAEGHFVRVARSGRTDFPRRESAPAGTTEWLTVRSATGDVGQPSTEVRGRPVALSVSGPAPVSAEPGTERVWSIPLVHSGPGGEPGLLHETFETTWEEDGRWGRDRTIEWEGPIIRSTWEAGPFSYPVEAERYVEERWNGTATIRSVEGKSHIVYGPWRVVIRGLGARAERRVMAVWEVHRSWIAQAGRVALPSRRAATEPDGSLGSPGASELRWEAASELRLGGASELHWLGASELRYLGASELLYAGASEWRARGASERRLGGGSELRHSWGSELRLSGGSELRVSGASERLHAGGSERLHPGGSERMWVGASDNRPRYPAEPADPTSPTG